MIDETEGMQPSESYGAKMEGKVGKDAVKFIENWLTKEKHEPLERTLTVQDLVDGPKETQTEPDRPADDQGEDEPEDQKRQEIEEDEEDAITESDENDIWVTALKSLDLEAWKPSDP